MIVGIVGGGQLARMLALAGHPLGLHFAFLDPGEDACAAPLGLHLQGDYEDRALLEQLAAWSDVVTYEFENVPGSTIDYLADHVPIYPGVTAQATAQDRLREKHLFQSLGIPTAPFAAVHTREELDEAVADIGLPALLKTRRMGYDGKGQELLREAGDLDRAWERLGDVPLILEGFVRFDREVSIIAARSCLGETVFYPLSENTHRNGILQVSVACHDDPMQAAAEAHIRQVLDAVDYVGVLALELFQVGDELYANEMAPRVHNSGHWTIEGAETSQFENHLRAILGWPLGSTAPVGHAAMVNCVGALPEPEQVLALPGVHFHHYDKAPRPGRKIGHMTVRAASAAELQDRIRQLLALDTFVLETADDPAGPPAEDAQAR